MEDYKKGEEYQLHEEKGFPMLTKQEQLEVLVHGKIEIVRNIVPGFENKPWNPKLLNHYITIGLLDVEIYLREIDFISKLIELNKKFLAGDGYRIIERKGMYELYWQERGMLQGKEFIGKYEGLITYLAKKIGGSWVKE